MVQRYEQTRKLQWYKCGAAYGLRRLNGTFLLYKLFTDIKLHHRLMTQLPSLSLNRRLILVLIDDQF